MFIPKPGTDERRPLSIPSVRDRIVQAAVKIVLEPIFEADFLPCSFGFRPKRAAHDGLQVLVDESFAGARWVVETDVADCFGSIPHSGLMSAVEERVSDRRLLALLRAFLRAGVMEQGTVRRPVTGSPQGGVIPVALQRLPAPAGPGMAWRVRDLASVRRRCAGDVPVEGAGGGRAGAADRAARRARFEAETGQDPDRAAEVGGEGVDFLGFHHRLVQSRAMRGSNRVTYLARWPSRKAMQHARDRIRFMTMRARLAAPVEQVVQEINLFLRGWAGYFRYGNSAHAFDEIRSYALMRLALFLAKRHQRGRAWGFAQLYRSPDDLGLISLNGIVVAPRPNRAWRVKPNTAGEGRR